MIRLFKSHDVCLNGLLRNQHFISAFSILNIYSEFKQMCYENKMLQCFVLFKLDNHK